MSKNTLQPDPRLSVDAKEFVPRSVVTSVQTPLTETDYLDQNLAALQDYMNDCLLSMSSDPAAFEIYAEDLLTYLNAVGIHNEEMLHLIVNMIFDFGLMDQNFRYSGARLCNLLSHRLTVSLPTTSFRTVLLQRCHSEFKTFKETVAMDPSYARSFALFLAELFIQLSIRKENQFTRVSILARSIPEMLEELLKIPSPENVKCVVQVFKLCGAFLEEEDICSSSGKTPLMDRVFRTLTTAASNPTISSQSKQLLDNILKLRSSNWGRETGAEAASCSSATSNDPNLIPAFTLTAEEEEFLASQNLASYSQYDQMFPFLIHMISKVI